MKDREIACLSIRESDHAGGLDARKPLFALPQDQHKVQGMTVFRSIAGFWLDGGDIHAADLLHITARLPLVIEFFHIPEAVAAATASLQGLVPPRHIVTWLGWRP